MEPLQKRSLNDVAQIKPLFVQAKPTSEESCDDILQKLTKHQIPFSCALPYDQVV